MATADVLVRDTTAARRGKRLDAGPWLTALTITAAAIYLQAAIGWRQSALFLVGVFAGIVLYHAAFGFTSSWRVMITDRRGAGLRAQMVMLAATCLVFFPLLASGSLFGQSLRGSVSPAGTAVIAGAFIFGIGMQLGGGCASGTLYTAGGGSVRMVITLLAFIVGSVIGTAHVPWWSAQPTWPALSLVTLYGAGIALAVSLSAFAAIGYVTVVLERRRHGSLEDPMAGKLPAWLRGPWPLVAGALGLAIVNIATLVLAGRPWGVTSAFALWGAKAAIALGIPVQTWSYWTAPAQRAALDASVLNDVTSIMNLGIVAGALLASLLAGRFAPVWHVPARSLAAAVIGGLLLGYGARVAFGCNIGAYFSGIASGSLHGWMWLPAGFAGSVLGTKLRPMFGLSK
jgi:uncharacterized membrane protein YedE/YeeE